MLPTLLTVVSYKYTAALLLCSSKETFFASLSNASEQLGLIIQGVSLHTPYVQNWKQSFMSISNNKRRLISFLLIFLQYSGLISYFAERAKNTVKAMDPTNELEYLRVTSKRHEILVAPDNDFVLIVMQNPGE